MQDEDAEKVVNANENNEDAVKDEGDVGDVFDAGEYAGCEMQDEDADEVVDAEEDDERDASVVLDAGDMRIAGDVLDPSE